MKVKDLIYTLLDMPMDANVIVSSLVCGHYEYRDVFAAVDYKDGAVGIITVDKED